MRLRATIHKFCAIAVPYLKLLLAGAPVPDIEISRTTTRGNERRLARDTGAVTRVTLATVARCT